MSALIDAWQGIPLSYRALATAAAVQWVFNTGLWMVSVAKTDVSIVDPMWGYLVWCVERETACASLRGCGTWPSPRDSSAA